MEKTKIIKKKKNPYIASLTFLLFVLIVTFGLYFYNIKIEKSNTKIEKNIAEYKIEIEKYENDEQLKIDTLLKINDIYLTQLNNNSKIVNFLEHLDYIKDTYDLNLRGFSFNKDIISTSVIVNSDEYSDVSYKLAYQKVVNFISKYRKDEKSLFDLEFVNKIVGYDEMKFDVNFKIK